VGAVSETLSTATEERILELCGQLAEEHALDEVLKERLHRFLLERARAYLRSDEDLTDDDAYVLIREDVRDARLRKRILVGLRCENAPIGVARRVAAVIVASMLALVLVTVLGVPVGTGVSVALDAWLGRYGAGELAPLVAYGLVVVGVPVLQVLLLRRWQRRLAGDGRSCASASHPWFVRWEPRHVLAAVALAVIWCAFWPRVQPLSGTVLASGRMIDTAVLWHPLSTIASCVIWLWWLDQAPGKRWASRAAFPSWALWRLLRYIVMILTPDFVFYNSLAESPWRREFETLLLGWTLPGGSVTFFLAMLAPPWRSVLLTGGRHTAGTTLVLGLVAWGVYAANRHVRRRGMPQEDLDFPWVR